LCIDDDMSCMMTWLIGDLFVLIWMTVEIFYFGVDVMMFYSAAMFRESCYLCMLGDLIEDVTSRFLLCCIISVIYRFESLGCYKRLRQLHALPPSSHLNLSISSTEYSLCTNNS